MAKSASKFRPFPVFERPSEAVVYWALETLCGGAGGRFMVSLSKLAKRCRLSMNTTRRAVLDLNRRGEILYRPGANQFHQTIFELPLNRGGKISQAKTAIAKNGIPIPSDKVNITKRLSIGDIDDENVVHKEDNDGDLSAEDRLAYQVAEGLNDIKNLKLYQSYCKKYPAQLILKAYIRAKEPARDKIRKSRGALFNYLVQRYAKRANTNNSGSASR